MIMCVYCGGTLKEATIDYVEKLTTMLLSLKMYLAKNVTNAERNIFPLRLPKRLSLYLMVSRKSPAKSQ